MTAKEFILSLIGLLFSVVPVLVTVLMYFPLWVSRGGAAVLSGMALLLVLISLSPIFRILKKYLSSPPIYTVWLILFIIFFSLSRIADEMTVICFVGFVTNLIGALFFKAAERVKTRRERGNEEHV